VIAVRRSRRTYAGTGSTRARPNWESGWSCRLRQTTASHARSTVSVGSRRSGIGSSILRVAIALPRWVLGSPPVADRPLGERSDLRGKGSTASAEQAGIGPTLRRRCTPGRRARRSAVSFASAGVGRSPPTTSSASLPASAYTAPRRRGRRRARRWAVAGGRALSGLVERGVDSVFKLADRFLWVHTRSSVAIPL